MFTNLLHNSHPVTCRDTPNDDFNGVDGDLFDPCRWLLVLPPAPTIQNNKLEFFVPTFPDSPRIRSKFELVGDYDIEWEFDIGLHAIHLTYLHIAILDAASDVVLASLTLTSSTTAYEINPCTGGISATSKERLRLQRIGTKAYAYAWNNITEQWDVGPACPKSILSTNVYVRFGGSSGWYGYTFRGTLDTFKVLSGTVIWP